MDLINDELKGQAADNPRNDFTLGVDIGGTKVAAGLVDASGTILFQTRAAMPARQDAAAGFAAVEHAINAVFTAQPQARAALTGIGICAPGPLDPIRGFVLNPPNLPCWRNFPLAAKLQRVFDAGAKVDNDANAAALAEAIWGAGVGFRNVLLPRWAPASGRELFSTSAYITGAQAVPRKVGMSASITTVRVAPAENGDASKPCALARRLPGARRHAWRNQTRRRTCESLQATTSAN